MPTAPGAVPTSPRTVPTPVGTARRGRTARDIGRAWRRVGDRGGGDRATGDRGSVTAEFAVLLPVVVLVLGVIAALTAGATTQLRCVDAARVGARAAALGEDDGGVLDAARRVAGPRARVVVSRADGWVDVLVESGVGPDLPLAGSLVVRGTASARAEP